MGINTVNPSPPLINLFAVAVREGQSPYPHVRGSSTAATQVAPGHAAVMEYSLEEKSGFSSPMKGEGPRRRVLFY